MAAVSYQAIIYEKRGRTAYITLNRPGSLNAISATMREELREALCDFDLDDEVWLAIVSGAGPCFTVGADLKQFGQSRGPTTSRTDHYFLDHPVNWKPVVAAVHGYCYGNGLAFVAECDLVVATADARFCMVETKRGMPPITIYAQLASWMGSKRATEMILTGDPLSATDGHRLGLVNEVVATQPDLLPAAERLAERVLCNPPLAVRTAVQMSRTAALQSQIHREADLLFRNTRWQDWHDHKESIRAFLEKRQPMYIGK